MDGSGWKPDDDYVPTQRDWYVTAVKGDGKAVLVLPYLDAKTDTMMISVSCFLQDKESVISLDIALNEIQNIAEKISLNNVGYGFIVDKSGTVVAHHIPSERGKNYNNDENMEKILANAKSGSSVFALSIDGENDTVFTNIVMDDWTVVLIVSTTKLFEEVGNVLISNIILCLAVFALITVFLTIAFRKIGKAAAREAEACRQLEKRNSGITKTLARVIDAKDRYTNGHSQRVAEYSGEIAKRMGKSEKEQEEIYYAGLLHDVGKIRVPAKVINKPGKLTEDEFSQIKIHPVTGYYILNEIYDESSQVAKGAKYHHERIDGHGYPLGLPGDKILEVSKIIGVADAYDAMASNRSYRNALPQEKVREEILKGKGTQFDPSVADIMLSMIDEDKDYKMREAPPKQQTILVVDRDSSTVETVSSIMSYFSNIRVLSAENAEEMLEIAGKTEIDVVLLDVSGQNDENLKSVYELRKSSRSAVVLMTADMSSTVSDADNSGADDYLAKPISPLILREMVHGILG